MSRAAWISAAAELAAGRPYAERSEAEAAWHDKLAKFLVRAAVEPMRNALRNPARSLRWIVDETERHDREMRVATDAELLSLSREMQIRLRREGFARPWSAPPSRWSGRQRSAPWDSVIMASS